MGGRQYRQINPRLALYTSLHILIKHQQKFLRWAYKESLISAAADPEAVLGRVGPNLQ